MTAPRRAAAASAVAAALALALSACGASSSDTAGTSPSTTHSRGTSSSVPPGPGHRSGHATHSSGRSGHQHATGPRSTAGASPGNGVDGGPTPSAGPTERPTASNGATRGSTTGVEIVPASPGASSSGLPGLSHGPSHTAPLIGTPLPPPASADGRLVSGYPARVLPGAPGSRILASSVAPSGNRLQVSLTARTGMRSLRLQAFYTRRLTGLGMQVGSTPTVGGSTGLVFSRGENQVTLTVTPGIVTRYSLFATFSAAR